MRRFKLTAGDRSARPTSGQGRQRAQKPRHRYAPKPSAETIASREKVASHVPASMLLKPSKPGKRRSSMTCGVAEAAPATRYLLRNEPPYVAYRSVRIGHLLRRTRAGHIPRALRQATWNAPRSHRRNAPRCGRKDVASIDIASLVDHGNRCAPTGSIRKVVGRTRGTPVRHGEYRESRDDRSSESRPIH